MSIYLESDKPKTVSQTDVDVAVKRAIQLYHKAINDLYTSFQKDNDTYEFAITLHDHKNDIKTVRICALTNGKVKPINFNNITISGAEVSFSIWDIDRLYRCVMSGKMRETIEIDFQEKYNLTVPCIENSASEKYSVYLAIISGELLAALYDEYRDRLLEKNVRSFLQVKGAVNKGIRDTLRDEPEMFLAYNNGISVTAEGVEIVRDENGKPSIKKIRDMQIVNGGQTTASIFNAKRDKKIDADLSKVFVGSMVGHYETMINELCALSVHDKQIYPKIIASTATISRAKEQCHALYGCPKEKVFQFPPSGLSAEDSFFAREDKERNGRKYVGILATGSSSDTTTAIRLYASLLYAAKELNVEDESKRDPYWTNVGYFNSIRELGQARTWIRADIDQHLDVIYKRRLYDKAFSKEEYKKRRRYIWRDEELTSRISGDKVTASLSNLNIRYPAAVNEEGKIKEYPIDICLATNMISVGLDVPRLGLMTVAGQPKTTSEYIQATSRVGRDAGLAPGIVFVLYRPGRPRDKSHYEHFKEYHSRLYCNVEPTSVTPFSAPVRDRALHAIMVGMIRLESDNVYNESSPHIPSNNMLAHVKAIIEKRIQEIDPEEMEDTMNRWQDILDNWEAWNPTCWEPKRNRDFSYTNDVPLMYSAGSHRNEAWGTRGIETPTSMRSVDASCEAEVLSRKYVSKGEE